MRIWDFILIRWKKTIDLFYLILKKSVLFVLQANAMAILDFILNR